MVFVIPNEKDREKVKEYCGEDSHIVLITTPGQVWYSPISAYSLWNVYLAHAILDFTCGSHQIEIELSQGHHVTS